MGIFSRDEDYFTEEYVKYYELKDILSHYFRCVGPDNCLRCDTCWEHHSDRCFVQMILKLKKIIDR